MDHDDPAFSSAAIQRLAARIDRPIVLVGMMGVGKTTVGRKLALMLGWPFCDADEEIEKAAHLSIPEIFAQFGEPYFRSGERRVIARLVGEDGAHERRVLATVGRKDNRPLLRTGNPREILTRLKAERGPAYAEAPIHITSGNQPHLATAIAILKAIDAWL